MRQTNEPRPPRAITPELIRDALHHVPPTVERETWVKLGMAVKAEMGSGGFDVWDAWSAQADNYSSQDARDTWRGIKAGGKVGVGSLFHIAKQYGFRFPDDDRTLTAAELAALHQQRQQAQAAQQARALQEQQAEAAAHERAAQAAAKLWESGQAPEQATQTSPYMQRKGVNPEGVRLLQEPEGMAVLVPLRDHAGRLWNVQTIHANGEKRFLKGGRKSGLWCMVAAGGEVGNAPALLLAEGLATALSLHQACGLPVAVAFDAGNLRRVAEALRAAHPAVPLLVCGDDDRRTQADTGTNPGRKYAQQAAQVAHGATAPAAVVFPEGLPDEGSDFNDLAQHAGLEAVAAIVRAALVQFKAGTATPPGPPPPAPPPERKPKAPPAATEGAAPNDPFFVRLKGPSPGLYFVGRDREGRESAPEWVCAPIVISAKTRTEGADQWGFLLEFTDPDGNPKTWAMPAQMLAGDGSEWAGYLRAMGLQMAPGTKARNLLARYIDTRSTTARATCTDRVGWHGAVYVLPSATLGTSEGHRYVFQSEGGIEDQYKQRGSLQAWQTEVAALAVGNSRLAFALCCAFAGPLLRLAGVESGGFQLKGNSSGGKTTALKVAASVFGPPGYMQRWRTTDNALEATAVQHSDSLLILDEFGQLDAKVAGECAYMLANEQEKGRATRGGLAKRRRTWRLLFLSSGELGLADHMRQAGKEVRAGQEVRFVDVPLEAGAGMGGLERLHGFESPQALAEAIIERAAQHYGTAGRAWLEWLTAHHATLPEKLPQQMEAQKAKMVPESAAQQVARIGNRFAVVAAAGELATQAGVTGWPAGEASAAVRECFNAWLGARGHMENGEEAAILRQVRAWLEKNGDALFTWSHRAMDDHRPNTPYRAGFKRLVDSDGKPLKFDAATDYMEKHSTSESSERAHAVVEYMVLPEAFRQEMAKGYDPGAVAAVLRRRGHLIHEKDRNTNKQRLPGMGAVPVFHIKPSLFADEMCAA
ncbi:DUF927 domain-containing protein [Roseateles sp. BYS180W]|uniref:DUF927 domain-containing protein n=1 Tax=Roseateles rivi TaxID=3299028 RepID=A0ABW7FXY0_9BURK